MGLYNLSKRVHRSFNSDATYVLMECYFYFAISVRVCILAFKLRVFFTSSTVPS